MNVSLTAELERFISEQVASGRFRSASEVVRAGVRLLENQEAEREARLAVLRTAVAQGIVEFDRGEGIAGEQVFDEILAQLQSTEQLL